MEYKVEMNAVVGLEENDLWQAVVTRDGDRDGLFVYAVRSTGIYCRPSCPSRKPKRESVVFFALPAIAKHAGFHACKRCEPDRLAASDPQVERVQDICRYIYSHLDEPLDLTSLGERFHTSPYHLQRLFKKVVGVTPAQYLQACRMDRVKAQLRQGNEISDALYEAGLSSTSRLYSQSSLQLGMTPRTYQKAGKGVEIFYTIVPCPYGYLLVAATGRGICAVKFGDSPSEVEGDLLAEFNQADLYRRDETLAPWMESMLKHLEGRMPHLDLPLDIQATAFQKQVWQAIQDIPYGETRTYSEVAGVIGKPAAVRAVGHACASNPVALLVPCQRVVRSDGGLGGYRWGLERKEAMLKLEKKNRESTI